MEHDQRIYDYNYKKKKKNKNMTLSMYGLSCDSISFEKNFTAQKIYVVQEKKI